MRPLMRMTMLVPVLLAFCAGCQQPVITKNDPLTTDQGGEKAVVSDLTGTASCSNRGCHASMDQSKASEEPLRDVKDAAKLLVDQIREGYRRIREAL